MHRTSIWLTNLTLLAVSTQIFKNLGPDAGAKLDMAAFAELRCVVSLDFTISRPSDLLDT